MVCVADLLTALAHTYVMLSRLRSARKAQKQKTAPSWNFTSNYDAVPPRLHRERCGGLGEPNASRWAHGTLGFSSSIAFSATHLGRDALGLHPRPMIRHFQALDRRLPASPELMTLLPSALQRLLASLRSPAFVRCTGLLPAGPSQFQRAPLTTWELSFEIRDVAQVLHRFMNGHWSHAFQLHLVHATLAGLATILRRHDHSTSTQPRHLCALVSRRTVRSEDLSSAFTSLLRRGILLGAPWMFPSVDIAKTRALMDTMQFFISEGMHNVFTGVFNNC